MKAFDFDNTLYRGESSMDFALFMIRNNKKILLYLPIIFGNAIKYKLCLVDRRKLEDTINKYLKIIVRSRKEIEDLVKEFWKKHSDRLDTRMLSLISPEDVIISAGPRFLLEGVRDRLGTSDIICSEVDLDRKEIEYFNFKDNKVRKFRELYGNEPIECFYTDSYNDQAVMDISERVFLVKKGRIREIK